MLNRRDGHSAFGVPAALGAPARSAVDLSIDGTTLAHPPAAGTRARSHDTAPLGKCLWHKGLDQPWEENGTGTFIAVSSEPDGVGKRLTNGKPAANVPGSFPSAAMDGRQFPLST